MTRVSSTGIIFSDASPTAFQHVKATAIAPGVAAMILPALIPCGTDHEPLFLGKAYMVGSLYVRPEVCLQAPLIACM